MGAKEQKTPQDRGRAFEAEWAAKVGAKPQKGSGNYYLWRLDVENRGRYLWSCKHTDGKSYRLRIEDIDEVIEAVEGPGGVGGETIPAMAISIGGRVFCLTRAEDFIEEHTQEAEAFIKPDKSAERRQLRKTPGLLRE